MIPQEKNEAVARGLREAFGVTAFDDISRMTGGRTASLVFRIVVRGSPYLLKIITREEDQARHYTNMRAAAAGVAPRVWYTNVKDRISITDFVRAEPLAMAEARVRLPAVLRTLHALPPFDRSPFNTSCTFLLHKGPALDGYLQKFQEANILPTAECEEWFARYAELTAVYPLDDGAMVASHNDLFKPDNILFDGERVWLVDWEAAFLNDRYADLAVVAQQVVTGEEEERVFLQEYFGTAPDDYQLARFHLMQQIAHLFYAMVFLHLGAVGGPIDWGAPLPAFGEYQRRRWQGDAVPLADREEKAVYGRTHWERFKHNVRHARYGEALRIVADRACGGGVAQGCVSGSTQAAE